MEPIFSIATCARWSQYYRGFYDSLAKNTNIPFEVIFVGPSPPTEKMPDNFTYILSSATPCQCIEIAVRRARGKYVMHIGDDHRFSDNFLNKLHSYTQRIDTDKVLISLRFWLDPIAKISPIGSGFNDEYGLAIDPGVLSTSIVGMGPVFRRDIWLKLGGLDRRFYGPFVDLDLELRFFEYGMNPFILPDCFINEIEKRRGPFKMEGWKKTSMTLNHGADAKKLLNSLWVKKDGTISHKRLYPVETFKDSEVIF